ncbi:response regulator [Pedobacter sp. MC2016-14]|uniref:response regulator n=1 Tax=Pedobacter sp. MC2016-14 TaxID=2897327 RepID=UPI001E375F02|nr:response regulator [Pedobacter sp. MC2016-14]MCD0487164.1 response regulator [Pedobacter sp. MC2016-14]
MMFERVLIAEDHENTSLSVQTVLKELGVKDPKYVFYCDDALAWIQKGLKTAQPYDLLITDLSFEEDHNIQKITDGTALIKAAKDQQPGLKILVFSAEGRADVIDPLIKNLGINAYVRKARQDAKELKVALEAISNGKRYFSVPARRNLHERNSYNFDTYDTTVIALLAGGMKQKDIPEYLKKNSIKPGGLSSVEKRLNLIKDVLGFSTNEQLIAYCKDYRII